MKDDSPTGWLAVSLKLQSDPSVGLKGKPVRTEPKWMRYRDERHTAPTWALQGAGWGLVNLAKLLGLRVEWKDPSGLSWDFLSAN